MYEFYSHTIFLLAFGLNIINVPLILQKEKKWKCPNFIQFFFNLGRKKKEKNYESNDIHLFSMGVKLLLTHKGSYINAFTLTSKTNKSFDETFNTFANWCKLIGAQ